MDEGVSDVSELDGLLTAVVSGPVMVPSSVWLQTVWGDFEPEWQSKKEFEKILSLMTRYMNVIAVSLLEDPEEFEPLYQESIVEGKAHTIVDEWCHGYMRGVALAAEA